MKNRFTLSEWSGAVGDLGLTLPIAFALVVFNGFPPERLFFLWGLVYLITGWLYKVPVSVQPLKAMAVIAITTGYSAELLSTTAFFYGLLLMLLSLTGMIRWLEHWFSTALVRGIQLGLGLMLAQKAITLAMENGVFFSQNIQPAPIVNSIIFGAVVLILWCVQFRKKFPVILVIIPGGIALSFLLKVALDMTPFRGTPVTLNRPAWGFLTESLLYLIIPQLPLTLGNAVFAASDACHALWKDQARNVTPSRLGFSIGLSDLLIGLGGGFPICHGAGGIAAHAQFGGKTGGATMILGLLLMGIAVCQPLAMFLFFIPVPVLGAMLLIESFRLMTLLQHLDRRSDMVVAVVVGAVSFGTRNLSLALLAGFLMEGGYKLYRKKYRLIWNEEKIV